MLKFHFVSFRKYVLQYRFLNLFKQFVILCYWLFVLQKYKSEMLSST